MTAPSPQCQPTTADEISARLAELYAKQEAATSWGAAVGARHEEIKSLKGRLAALQRPSTGTAEALADKITVSGQKLVMSNHLRYVISPAERDQIVAALRGAQAGQVPDRETLWLVERTGHGQYVKDRCELPGLTNDPWRATRFATEREAHDFWLRLATLRDECKPVEHMFINKVSTDAYAQPVPLASPPANGLPTLDEYRDCVIEECAKVAEDQRLQFLSPQYAANQPYGSICERFACEVVARAIRALAPPSTQGKCTCNYIHGHAKDCPAHSSTQEKSP